MSSVNKSLKIFRRAKTATNRKKIGYLHAVIQEWPNKCKLVMKIRPHAKEVTTESLQHDSLASTWDRDVAW